MGEQGRLAEGGGGAGSGVCVGIDYCSPCAQPVLSVFVPVSVAGKFLQAGNWDWVRW